MDADRLSAVCKVGWKPVEVHALYSEIMLKSVEQYAMVYHVKGCWQVHKSKQRNISIIQGKEKIIDDC